MGRNNELTERKPKSRVWSFIGGSLFGILLCVIIIAGTLAFAYFKVSPNWINDKFNTNIDLGNDTANNKTIKNFVDGAMRLAQNVDSYTINDLKKDFGIEIQNNVYGIDISDLKNVPFSELSEKVEEKVQNLTAYELDQIDGVDLQGISDILNKKNTYYYNPTDKKLTYQDSTCVEFQYSVNDEGTKATIKNKEISIIDNKIEVQLWDLPIFIAIDDFVANMGNQVTLQELEEGFGVKLPSMLDGVDKENTTINELNEVMNDLTVADFLNYTVDTTTEPGKTIVKDKNGNVISGIESALATFKIGELSDGINTLDLQDVFEEEEFSTGILNIIDKTTKINEVATVINERMKTVTLGELVDNKIITLDTSDSAYFAVNRNKYIAGTDIQLKNISISDMSSFIFTFLPLADAPTT